MLKCAYMIFTTDASVSATTRQVSAKEFFSHLSIREAGTTTFSFVIGVWGIPVGKTGSLELHIASPDGKTYVGRWTSNESKDEAVVQTVIFNCSKIPLTTDGNYIFSVVDKQTVAEIGQRVLKVSFAKGEEETYE